MVDTKKMASNTTAKAAPPKHEICKQPMAPGPCKEKKQMFYYNIKTGSCEEFTYGGCMGNYNRFRNTEDCKNMCVGAPKEEPYHPPAAAVPVAASAASLLLVLGAIVLWWFLMRRQELKQEAEAQPTYQKGRNKKQKRKKMRLRKKQNKIPGRFGGSHRSHTGSFIGNSFKDSSRHGSMKERALMTKTSRNSSLSKKSNGHAHKHKCSCNCGDSPLLKKHSPRNSRQSLGEHSSFGGNSPFCNHTRRYLYQQSLLRDSMDSDYYADDDATHSGANSDNTICTCGVNHGQHPDRTSKHSLPETTVVTIEHNSNNPQRPQMSPEKVRRYQSKPRGVKLQAMKKLQLSQPYSYDMCMCELPSTSNTQTSCMCSSASHSSLNGSQKRGLSASAPNLADLERKETQT